METPNARFELPENWQRIEFTGFEGNSNTRKRLAHFLGTAQQNQDDCVVEEDRIIVKMSPENQRCEYLITVISVMQQNVPGLQIAVY